MPDGHLINTNSLKINKSYVFIYSNEENVLTEDNRILVYTSKIKDGRILEFPVSGIDIKTSFSDKEKVRIGKTLIFADFPYKKENLRYLIDKMCSSAKNSDIDVVLYNERRRAGYTDIEKSEKIIREAYEEFGSFGVDIYEYFPGSEKTAIFSIRPDNLRYIQNRYKKELKGSQYRVENRFEIHYKTFLERTYEHYFSFNNPVEFSRYLKLFEFGTLPVDTDDIYGCFADSFKTMYLSGNSDILEEISDFYLDYISEILSFRLDEESDYIKKYVVALFDKYFMDHPKIGSGKTELEYKGILNKNNIVTDFTKKIDDFFHVQLPHLMLSAAKLRVDAVKSVINHSDQGA
jgi:hypothetical protein